ncbi:hypothetical protein SAMN05444141_11415 [Pseudovibrio denitrificans]|uniref:His-Xaa-Ser system protein HxsD n=1 Tax=Pseudovibrio denitrificans TaxID=258256 RepID=A0A1I7DZA7_9HYPH|nr:hypothetical protein [Pseudovibrio denitrificans]SFU17021.1 hypothetical protein SAMN05444141_11415 [Pseudovibrio denitrificans]
MPASTADNWALEFEVVMTVQCEIKIPETFLPVKDDAYLRLTYLYPELEIELHDTSIVFRSIGEHKKQTLKREVSHTLYREKMRADSTQLRQSLLQVLS